MQASDYDYINEEDEKLLAKAAGIQMNKRGEDAVNSITTFVPALAIYQEKTFPCEKCGAPNTISQAGYFCTSCVSAMGIGTEKGNYKHGYV